MNPKTLHTSAWILSMAVVALLCASVVAQVPELGYVVSSHRFSSDPGVGGLYIVPPPSSPALPVSTVGGLSSDLTGSTSSSPLGASSVLITDATGTTLAVGETGPQGTAIHLHLVTLSGNTAISDVTYFLGTELSSYGGGIMQSALLPNGDVLLGTFGVGSSAIWKWSSSTGTVVQLPVTFPVPWTPGQEGLNALCVNPAGTIAYAGLDTGYGTSAFYSIALAGPSYTVTTIGTVPMYVSGLLYNPNGTLTATSFNGTYDLWTVNLASSTISPSCSPSLGYGGLNAVARGALR